MGETLSTDQQRMLRQIDKCLEEFELDRIFANKKLFPIWDATRKLRHEIRKRLRWSDIEATAAKGA